MIHEYNGKENLKDALRHYGRKGMRKGFHLPGTEWWKSGGSSPRAKSVSTVYKSQEGQREDDLDLEKRRDKAASRRIKLRDEHWKGTVHNIRPQKSAGAITNIRPGSVWAELAKRRKR